MTPLPRPKPEVVFTTLEDGIVLLDAANGVYFGLNAVGAEMWKLLPPECETVDQLCARISAQFPDVRTEAIREDVEELLQTLVTNDLVTPVMPGRGTP